MEILGLTLVVALVLIATFFVVRFLVFKTPTDYRKGFISSELAPNMLNTFLKTNAEECFQLSMTELIHECIKGTFLECDNGQQPCGFVNSTANTVFSRTLDEWKYKYEFLIYDDDINSPKINLGERCEAGKKSKLFPIPSSTNTIYVKLNICA